MLVTDHGMKRGAATFSEGHGEIPQWNRGWLFVGDWAARFPFRRVPGQTGWPELRL